MAYSFGVGLLDKEIQAIPPGSNVLLTGPPMMGKAALARTILYESIRKGGGGIYVSTKDTPGQLRNWFNANGMDVESFQDRMGIIDCISRTLDFRMEEPSPNVIQVASAVDLNGISISLNRFLTKFFKEMLLKEAVVAVESLSNVLMFTNLQTVYRFLYVFSGRIRASGCIGLYTLDEGMHSPETTATIKQVCQGVVDMKADAQGRYMNISGLTASNPSLRYNLVGGRIQ